MNYFDCIVGYIKNNMNFNQDLPVFWYWIVIWRNH